MGEVAPLLFVPVALQALLPVECLAHICTAVVHTSVTVLHAWQVVLLFLSI